MEQSPELKNFMLRVYEALGKADNAFFDRSISAEEGLLAIGTDPKEYWTGKDSFTKVLKAQLAEMGGFPLVADAPQAYREGSVGWVADQPKIRLPDGTEMPIRLTLVCHQENNEWKIVQWHASIGVANEEALGAELTTE